MLAEVIGAIPTDLRFRGRSFLLDHRLTSDVYMRLRPRYEEFRIRPDTELVIDGFPRSANSYAWFAMQRASDGHLSVSGHTHAAATVTKAVRRRLPCIVLIREPVSAISSICQMPTGPDPHSAIKAYIRFYSVIARLSPSVIISPFEETISDFGASIRRCNAKYGTNFPPYIPTAEDESAIMSELDAANRRFTGGQVNEATVARPSLLRRRPEEVLGNLNSRSLERLESAERIYQKVSSCASNDG